MNSAVIVMTLLGCSQGETSCEYIRTLDQTYASRAECVDRTADALMRSGSEGYPTVIAVCEERPAVAAGQQPAGPAATPGGDEPRVVRSEFDRPNLLARAVGGTKRMLGGIGRMVGAAFDGLTRGLRREREPTKLGHYVPEES